MTIATKLSVVTMTQEETRFFTVLAFLVWRFNGVTAFEWQQRMLAGKMLWDNQRLSLFSN